MYLKTFSILAATVLAGSLLAACGSSSNSTETSVATTGSAASTEGAASESGSSETLVAEPPTEPPTSISVTTPVSKKPPTGVSLAYAVCNLPACEQYTKGFEEATKALGWKFQTFSFESAKPEPAIQQAIAAGVDYIAINGAPVELYKNGLEEANSKGIKVISAVDTSPPEPEKGLIAQLSGISGYGDKAIAMSDWAINHSEGTPDLVFVNVPEFPILTAGYERMQKSVAEECEQCKVSELGITIAELTKGQIPAKLVSYLQSQSATNQVVLSFADLLPGVYPALNAAGLTEKVGVTGISEQPSAISALSKGEVPAWLIDAHESFGWTEVDAAVRDSVGDPQLPNAQSDSQFWIADTKQQAKELEETNNSWAGPENYQEEYEAIWKLK